VGFVQPYDPQRPATPESFAGRQDLVTFVGNAIQVGGTLHRGSAVLLYGYRGSGKTSALRKIQSVVRAATPKAVIVEVPLRIPSSEAMLVHGIAEMVRGQAATQTSVNARVKRALERLNSVTVLGSGIGMAPARAASPSALLGVWQDALTLLEGRPMLCICIDDAELLKSGEIGILKTMVESDSPVPLFICVAGGPELLEKLSQREASPILRAFSGAIFDIGQFTLEETKEALEAPLKAARSTSQWDQKAVATIQRLTHGYPYLVQCFAAATYREGQRLKGDDVEKAIPAALSLASSWLEREIPEASDEDIRAFAKIASLGSNELRSADALRLGINHIYLSRLQKLGVLKRVARGHYELRKAPAIAYFHALRRSIDVS
jgi:energy-coupling factor transporter ATP-binding protein EcfA2